MNELSFKNHEAGLYVANNLLHEGYVVLLSLEEDLLVLNWEFTGETADRNEVMFMHREEFQDKYVEYTED